MDRPHFKPFDPHAEVTIYRRNMPHWRQKGCTYFITFRQADSIPRSVQLRWREERDLWLKAHGITKPLRTKAGLEQYLRVAQRERRTFEKRQGKQLHIELDRGHGTCLFRIQAHRDELAHALHHFHGERLWCGDWVIMPNHAHWLMTPRRDWEVERLLQSIKRHVSLQLTQQGISKGSLWQKESYDRIVRDYKELRAYRKYIAENPMKAGLRRRESALFRASWLDDELDAQSIPD